MQMTGNISSKGQITIPKAFREEYGLFPNGKVEFEKTERGFIVRPPDYEKRKREMKAALEKMRGSAQINTHITTDEMMALMRGEEESE